MPTSDLVENVVKCSVSKLPQLPTWKVGERANKNTRVRATSAKPKFQ